MVEIGRIDRKGDGGDVERNMVSKKSFKVFEPVCRVIIKWICGFEQASRMTGELATQQRSGMRICLSDTAMM